MSKFQWTKLVLDFTKIRFSDLKHKMAIQSQLMRQDMLNKLTYHQKMASIAIKQLKIAK